MASACPSRGLVINNATGKYQCYAWSVYSGELRQLTQRITGVTEAVLSGDGRCIYYLEDKDGNETGHLVEMPYEGGSVVDITPELPFYSALSSMSSGSGSHFAFMAANQEGFQGYCLSTTKPKHTLRRIFHSDKIAFGPVLSYEGEIAVIATTNRSTLPQYSLIALDVASGAQIGQLWDGPETSLEPWGFVHKTGDMRMIGTSNRTGVRRPFIWSPLTGERVDMDCSTVSGEVYPIDWSQDGRFVLLCHFAHAVQQLYIYDLTADRLKKLNHPSGTFGVLPIQVRPLPIQVKYLCNGRMLLALRSLSRLMPGRARKLVRCWMLGRLPQDALGLP